MQNIRMALEKDISRIAEIIVTNYRVNFYPFFKNDAFYFSELNVLDIASEYQSNAENLKHTFVYDDGVIKGIIRLNGSEIEKLYVEPQFQNQGIGAKLIQFAVQKNADFLWVLEYNRRAVAFYERNGFKLTEEKIIEYDFVPLLKMIRKENSEKFILLDETYLPQMAELYQRSFSGEPWNDDWSNAEQLKEYIKEISGCYHALNYGLFIDGKLVALSVGMIRHWWEGTNYNIEEFCIAPEMQHQGLGTRFMQMIEKDIRKRGLAGVFLQTDSDKPSYRFYQKNGFQELNTHVSFYKRVAE